MPWLRRKVANPSTRADNSAKVVALDRHTTAGRDGAERAIAEKIPVRAKSAMVALLGLEADGAIESDGFAVEVTVLGDRHRQRGALGGGGPRRGDLLVVGDVALGEPGAVQFGGQGLAAFDVAVDDGDQRSRSLQFHVIL
jgi:hypothetical protein